GPRERLACPTRRPSDLTRGGAACASEVNRQSSTKFWEGGRTEVQGYWKSTQATGTARPASGMAALTTATPPSRWPVVPCPWLGRSEEHTSELQSRFDLV